GVQPFIGKRTQVARAGGGLVVPGLVDAHIHPLDIVDLDVCDLDSKGKTLKELSAFVAGCIKHYHPAAGKWLKVHQWSPDTGNQPDAEFKTLKVALDRASTTVKIELLGNDGHHAAYNSAALASAKNAAGKVVGISKATLATDFAAYKKVIATDEQGDPDGMVNEDA